MHAMHILTNLTPNFQSRNFREFVWLGRNGDFLDHGSSCYDSNPLWKQAKWSCFGVCQHKLYEQGVVRTSHPPWIIHSARHTFLLVVTFWYEFRGVHHFDCDTLLNDRNLKQKKRSHGLVMVWEIVKLCLWLVKRTLNNATAKPAPNNVRR